MKSIKLLLASTIVFVFFSCNQQSGQTESEEPAAEEQGNTQTEPMEEETPPAEQITLTPLTDSPKFPDASLTMNAPQGHSESPVHFDFTVNNYELGVQTSDAEGKGLANSGNGQHIHLILNNGPYTAHYEPQFDKEMEDGHYVCLAFLSRSYHESVKAPNAFVVSQFTVGEAEDDGSFDSEAPQMFYSRPKGTYSGKDAERVLLDFFLYNVDLSEDGYKVKATVNGTEFTLTKWQPYVIQGAPMGDLTVRLELVDAEGNTVESPFNPVERVVKLEAEPAS